MAIRVTHPSGATVEFSDGTDSATIEKAMRQLDGGAPPQPQQRAAEPQPTQQPSVSTGSDLASSLGAGLVRGVAGIGGMAGNIESLGRAGINKVASKVGSGPVVDPATMFPTSSDVLDATEYIFQKKVYEPQTTAGEYTRTLGEFAPAALFPGGAAVRATNVAAPAIASETAGQLTEGTGWEPWARALGGLGGGLAASGVLRAVTPLPAGAQHAAAVQRLQNEGITDLTAGQITGSRPLRWAESVAQDTPLSGGRAGRLIEGQGEQFTQAALRRAGIDANRATPEVINNAFETLGQQFNTIARQNGVAFDRQLIDDLTNVVGEYQSLVPPTMQAPIVANVVDDLVRTAQANPNAAGMAGDMFAALRSRVSRMAADRHQDPQLAQALRGVREALDDAVARTNPQVAEQWQNLRQQYASLVRVSEAMAGAGEATAQGLLSPAQLRNSVKTNNKRAYVRGQSDLGNMARDAEAVMKALPNSGTPARQGVQSVMNVGSALVGNAAGGLPGAAAALAAPGLLSRGLMSAPMQRYLANALATPAINALEAGRLPAWIYAPQAAMEAMPGVAQEPYYPANALAR